MIARDGFDFQNLHRNKRSMTLNLKAPEGLAAFKRITRRWVRGEVGHDEVEPWKAFRARIARALEKIAAVGRGKTALVFTSAGAVAVMRPTSKIRVVDVPYLESTLAK